MGVGAGLALRLGEPGVILALITLGGALFLSLALSRGIGWYRGALGAAAGVAIGVAASRSWEVPPQFSFPLPGRAWWVALAAVPTALHVFHFLDLKRASTPEERALFLASSAALLHWASDSTLGYLWGPPWGELGVPLVLVTGALASLRFAVVRSRLGE